MADGDPDKESSFFFFNKTNGLAVGEDDSFG